MSKNSYIIFNGNFFDTRDTLFKVSNRAFRYGDGVFETMFASGGTVPLFKDHYSRLKKSAKKLKLVWPQLLSSEILKKDITRLINKNRIFGGARIRLSIFREDGGLYLPDSNRTDYLIEALTINQASYNLNDKGLKLGLYSEIKKSQNSFSGFKSMSASLFVMAALFCKESGFDDCFIINESGNIAEAVSSNVFICKSNNIYTPSIDSGCVEGVMRKNIIRIASKSGYTVYDDAVIKPENLLKADEVFLSNAVTGIRWVLAYKNKRYYNRISTDLVLKINEDLF